MNESHSYSDEELLLQLRDGNETAFTGIYNRYWERLFFMAHKRLQSAEDAKEIIQNVFFSLWQKRETLAIQNLPLYLSGMVRYSVYRYLDNRNRREKLVKGYAVSGANDNTKAFDLDNKQLLEILTELTSDLPENYRLIFIHHKLLDRPLEEVAAEMGVSIRTAERYVMNVMRIMREHRHRLTFLALALDIF